MTAATIESYTPIPRYFPRSVLEPTQRPVIVHEVPRRGIRTLSMHSPTLAVGPYSIQDSGRPTVLSRHGFSPIPSCPLLSELTYSTPGSGSRDPCL